MKITRAAIRYKDKIFTGFDHGECFKQTEKENITDTENLEQGFITDENEFVDRNTALDIAYKAGQITYDKWNHCLISEDLHLYWLNEQDKELSKYKKQISELKTYKQAFKELEEWATDIWRRDISKNLSDGSTYQTEHLISPKELLHKMQEFRSGGETNETK